MPFISKRKLNELLTAQHTAGFERGLAQGLALADRDAAGKHDTTTTTAHVTPTNRTNEGGRPNE